MGGVLRSYIPVGLLQLGGYIEMLHASLRSNHVGLAIHVGERVSPAVGVAVPRRPDESRHIYVYGDSRGRCHSHVQVDVLEMGEHVGGFPARAREAAARRLIARREFVRSVRGANKTRLVDL